MPAQCGDCELRRTSLCRAASEARGADVRPPRIRRLRRDEVIESEGESAHFMGVLRSGYLRRERMRPDGHRTVLGLACPGDLVGGLPGQRFAFSLEAATDAEICSYDPQSVAHLLARDRVFHRSILLEVCAQHERQLDLIWQRGLLNSRERIMAFLVKACRIMPLERQPDGSVVVTIALSRRDWADLSNTTVESISRTLSQLAEKDLVVRISPQRYRIRDLELLMRLAGMDPEDTVGPRPWLGEEAAPAEPLSVSAGPSMRVVAVRPSRDSRPPLVRRRDSRGRRPPDLQQDA
ncbi:transcriptional regulator, Crp/Fnr family [Salipiger mucosus DSM 16094]|uniref:Transcriptional regulator, Crp/Fnr family n=2 Tax=Salipiger mucosus TaxID=263378 RepID=S9QVR7_9RHOB|nr:transcriptional regulator, Crp/Fnr family [Salipiger mucosus DSM 16094]